MTADALSTFITQTRGAYDPHTREGVEAVRARLERLARASADEPWLAALLRDAPPSQELARDATHGFVLLAHTEPAHLYRAPHDHGRSWVVYALQRGAMEIGTYARDDADGRARLARRDVSVLRAGEARVYWEGDIHDTRCLEEPSLLLRFTARDLTRADESGRITRYVDRGGVWTVA
jgi:hypothetical protein